MSDEPVQCPECNRWSDRAECVKFAGEDYKGEEVWACLAPDCAACSFRRDSDNPILLNVDAIRDSDRTLLDVKHEKLENYENIDS